MNRRVLPSLLLGMLLGTSALAAAPPPPPPPGGDSGTGASQRPPAEAFAACRGKRAGSVAQFVDRRGPTITGVCQQSPDGMVLRPYANARRGGEPDSETTGSGGSTASMGVYTGSGSVTRGVATTTVANLFPPGSRAAAVGTLSDGERHWTVPAETRFGDRAMPFASNLYNPYVRGHAYARAATALAALDGSDIVEVDPDGELVTAYVFADNYFEMYVNGVPVGKDPVPYTEFNSNIVRFRVKPPFTVAMLLVDWEEHLGTGTEAMRGGRYHAGDGGMVAVFKSADGKTIGVTDGSWKTQTYYTAPVTDLSCLSESGEERLSSRCGTALLDGTAGVHGVHWARPAGWMDARFDDSGWPRASTFGNQTVGVDNKPAYTNFTALFDDPAWDAQFIWSTNLVLDNEVLVRGRVGGKKLSSGSFELSSPAVKADKIVPLSATCDGTGHGRSIPLNWSGAPAGTRSFALTMHHFPNPNDVGDFRRAHSYWSVYDIPATTTALAEGETDIGRFGINSVDGRPTYTPPCSADAAKHAYTITLHALSAPVGGLPLSGRRTDLVTLRNAIAPYLLGTATLTLTRKHYNPHLDNHLPSHVAATCAEKAKAFAPYSDYVSINCDGNTFRVTSESLLPYRSGLDADKPNVGTQSWIGRVPLPQRLSWSLPIRPSYLPRPESNVNIHDAIGISVEGIPILHYAKEAGRSEIAQLGKDYSDRDTILLGEVDRCGGHAGNGEDYHYHMAPLCLMDSHDPSQPLAYMFDGLPLYFGTAGGVFTRGGTNYGAGRYAGLNYLPQRVKSGERPLDECNAYDLHGDGSEYVYYSTATPPYTIGCYRARANQVASVPGGAHWRRERDLAWSGSDVVLTDYDTMSFAGKSWRFIEITPKASNNKIGHGHKALIMYRQLSKGESGYQWDADCYAFRYRLDGRDTSGRNDTATVHCR